MTPGINLQNEASQQILRMPLQHTGSQSETSQEYEKQSKKNRSTEEINSEGAEINTNDHTSTNSNGSLSNGSTASTGQEIVKPIEDIGGRIDAITKALAEINNGITSLEEDINKEVVENSSSDIQDEIYKKKETKPRLTAVSSDINYKKNKGGNYHMALMYDSGNNVTFSKDDDPVIIIKNDNIKNEGDYWRFVAKIRECCEQKISKGKKYYFEDYLDDHGFIEKEIDINEIRREIELLRKKKFCSIQK